MTVARIRRVAVSVDVIEEPALIAPRGEHFHRPQKYNPGDYIYRPVCRGNADGWVAVDVALAYELGRTRCGHCWDGDAEQLTISDTEET